MWRARFTPLFFFYFISHLAGTVTQETAFWFFGDESVAYRWTYSIGSGLICLFALWISWDNVPGPQRSRKIAIPAVLAVTVARMVALGMPSGLKSGTWLLLVVGAILFFCGQVASAAAAYTPRNHTALLILGLLWLSQAMYFFGYLLHAPEWMATGYWLPALLACLGFLSVGWFLKPPKSLFPLLLKQD